MEVYILDGTILSICQYSDDCEDRTPDSDFIEKCLECIGNKTLALDIGLLKNGDYTVIELNEARSIGKYQGLSDKDYFDFLLTR